MASKQKGTKRSRSRRVMPVDKVTGDVPGTPRDGDWKTAWRSFLEKMRSADEVTVLAIEEYESDARWKSKIWKVVAGDEAASELERHLTGPGDRGKDDLVALARQGANPAIVMRLLDSLLMNLQVNEEENEAQKSEFEKMTRPDYWKKKVLQLEKAKNTLLDFMATGVYKDMEWQLSSSLELQIYPFARLCKEVRATEKALDDLLRSIRELRLGSGARNLTYNRPYVDCEPAEGTRGPKRGSGEIEDWDRCAYRLWKYFIVRTRKPQWKRIARLLHFAGHGFAGVAESSESCRVAQDEIDRIRKRVQKLRCDPKVTPIAGDQITKLEEKFETRPHEEYGGFLTCEASYISPEEIDRYRKK